MIELNTLSELGLARPETTANPSQGELQQEEFLELMLTQLSNQDPLSPMENGEFLSQLAQFGTVSGIEDLQSSVSQLASSLYSDQALQASSLIGRDVLVPSSRAPLADGGSVGGSVELPTTTGNLRVRVTDLTGSPVREINLGPKEAGLVQFEWDGADTAGAPLPPGNYRFEAIADNFGVQEQVPVLIEARVDSVTLGNVGGVLLNLNGVGETSLGDVRRITERTN